MGRVVLEVFKNSSESLNHSFLTVKDNVFVFDSYFSEDNFTAWCEGLKPPLESFSRIDHAVIVMSNNY